MPIRHLPSARLPRRNGSEQGTELPDVPPPERNGWTCPCWYPWPEWTHSASLALSLWISVNGQCIVLIVVKTLSMFKLRSTSLFFLSFIQPIKLMVIIPVNLHDITHTRNTIIITLLVLNVVGNLVARKHVCSICCRG